jgi:hypothetical protein
MNAIFAQLKQEDVFKSISKNVSGPGDPTVFYAVILAVAAIILVVVVINALRKREPRARSVNHHGKLLKEVLKRVSLRKAEVRALRTIAAEQACESPLTLVLCPSLLAKGINAHGKADRKTAMLVARKVGLTTSPNPRK